MFNMINGKAGPVSEDILKLNISDMQEAHKLDPPHSARTSAWCRAEENEQSRDIFALMIQQFTGKVGTIFHHAGGPHVWNQSLYKSPTDYYNYTANKKDIVFWGEEGAISTPSAPRKR